MSSKNTKQKNRTMAYYQSSDQLTIQDIDNIHSDYEEQKEVEFLHHDKKYVIKVDKKFQLTKLDLLINELKNKVQESKDSNIELSDEAMSEYIRDITFVLILKYFTNLPIENGLNSIQMLAVFKKILNLGMFELVWNAFEEEQINWLNHKFIQVATHYSNLNEKITNQFLKGLDAKDDAAQNLNLM